MTQLTSAAGSRFRSPAGQKAVAGVVFALVLAAAGWYVWWFLVGSHPRERTVVFNDPPRVRGNRGGGGNANPGAGLRNVMTRLIATQPPGVRPIRSDEWLVKAGNVQVRVKGTGAGGAKVDAAFTFAQQNQVFPADQLRLVRARGEILRDANVATVLGVTPEQREALRKANARPDVVLSDADRAKVLELWTAYATAADGPSKAEAEKALLAALDEAGKRAVEPSKAALAQKVQAVQGALTAEQWAKYGERGR